MGCIPKFVIKEKLHVINAKSVVKTIMKDRIEREWWVMCGNVINE